MFRDTMVRIYEESEDKLVNIWMPVSEDNEEERDFIVTVLNDALDLDDVEINSDEEVESKSETIKWEINDEVVTAKNFISADYNDDNINIVNNYAEENNWINKSANDVIRYQSEINNNTCYSIEMAEHLGVSLSISDNCYDSNGSYLEDLLSNGDEKLLIGDYLDDAPLV